MRDRWHVAVLDSGLRDRSVRLDPAAQVGSAALRDAAVHDPAASCDPAVRRYPVSLLAPAASCHFSDDGRAVRCSAVVPDPLGHGTSVAEVICGNRNGRRGCDLFVGQVLDHRGVTTAAALAAAIHWSVEVGADLIHMSLGLREDRQTLAEAVSAAVAAGCIIVASTPARGEGTYPARYPEVIRATGDARCRWDEISDLHSSQADFGGCPRHASGPASSEHPGATRVGGASLGAAHVTRFLVEHIAPGSDAVAVRVQLGEMARYAGVESRSIYPVV